MGILNKLLLENTNFTNWVKPSMDKLKLEYKVEHELKGKELFDDFNNFLSYINNSQTITVTPQMDDQIYNRSQTEDFEELHDLISSYSSYPEFRNEDTLKALYQGFEDNKPMDLPIIVKEDGEMTIFSGNTRMDVAFQLNINPKVILIEL